MILRHDAVEDLIVLGSRRLTAYDPVTGQERWWAGGFPEETVGVPVAGDGLVVASVPGVVTVMQISDTLRVLARNELGEGSYATPAVAGNQLYLCTVGHLYAFGR